MRVVLGALVMWPTTQENTNFGPCRASSDVTGKQKLRVARMTQIVSSEHSGLTTCPENKTLCGVLHNLQCVHGILFIAVEIVLMARRAEEKRFNGLADYFDCFDYFVHSSCNWSSRGCGGDSGGVVVVVFWPSKPTLSVDQHKCQLKWYRWPVT